MPGRSLEVASYVILGRRNVDRVPPEEGFVHGSQWLRPFTIGHMPKIVRQKLVEETGREVPITTAEPTLWCINQGGLEVPVALGEVPGIRALGSVSVNAGGQVGADVEFNYYKASPSGPEREPRRVAAQAIGYGVLNDPGHRYQEPTFYLIGTHGDTLKHFSMAQIIGGPLGDPLDPTFRAIMGIDTANGYPPRR